MSLEHYKDYYTTDDFILDEEFREIVRNQKQSLYLRELKTAFPERKREIDTAIQILKELQTKQIRQSEKRKHELWRQILQSQTKQVSIYRNFGIAASLLLLITIGGAVIYRMAQKRPDPVITSVESPINETRLILANGKSIAIDSRQSTVQYTSDGSAIMVNDSSEIALKVQDEAYNQMIVPYGKRSFVILSDGTRVWINSGSKLIFPPVFRGKNREVVLEGEAFFEVTEDKAKPFFVKTDLFRMKVYGTRFNVQAYRLDQEYNIVLVEGKVSMNPGNDPGAKELFLEPSQRASISKSSNTFEVRQVENTDVYTAWIDGYLTFINEDLSDVLKRVSRYYNVEISCELTDEVEKIYGKLDLKDNMERVLDGIAFTSKTRYKKEENKYVFVNIK
ncbi:MAG: FecR family protein [Mangrovibacterium sp.]